MGQLDTRGESSAAQFSLGPKKRAATYFQSGLGSGAAYTQYWANDLKGVGG